MATNNKYEAYTKYPFSDFFGTVVKQEVIRFLTGNPEQEFSVLDIAKNIGLNASSLSKPLAVLSEGGILDSREDGKFRYYKMKKHYAMQFKDIYNTLETVQAAALRDLKTT